MNGTRFALPHFHAQGNFGGGGRGGGELIGQGLHCHTVMRRDTLGGGGGELMGQGLHCHTVMRSNAGWGGGGGWGVPYAHWVILCARAVGYAWTLTHSGG
jgi:hypothetical protein